MIPDLGVSPPTLIVAVAVVVGLVVGRVYFGSLLFDPCLARLWDTVRGAAIPIIDRLRASRLPTSPSFLQSVPTEQYAATVDLPEGTLGEELSAVRPVEIPLLAGYKTDWRGRDETATYVWQYGPKPWPTAPRWLRRYQVHVTVFEDTVTAHREANSYRPDLWADHLLTGESYSVSDGVDRTRRALKDADIQHTTTMGAAP